MFPESRRVRRKYLASTPPPLNDIYCVEETHCALQKVQDFMVIGSAAGMVLLRLGCIL